MNSRARRLTIPLTGVLMIAGVIGATTTGADAGTAPKDVVSSQASETANQATSFWSPERMRKATDATGDLDLSVKGGKASSAAGPDGPGGAVPALGAGGGKSPQGE